MEWLVNNYFLCIGRCCCWCQQCWIGSWPRVVDSWLIVLREEIKWGEEEAGADTCAAVCISIRALYLQGIVGAGILDIQFFWTLRNHSTIPLQLRETRHLWYWVQMDSVTSWLRIATFASFRPMMQFSFHSTSNLQTSTRKWNDGVQDQGRPLAASQCHSQGACELSLGAEQLTGNCMTPTLVGYWFDLILPKTFTCRRWMSLVMHQLRIENMNKL